ncbi:hemicentin-2-like [Helicoverpa zea]|uniref:hemicentin-2-like n=1 Tax=Helicoverpa zea TaxID=7113 RepID=UPI001F5669F8|nr:hemicentin-2-like [Helicoverpa zea]
MCGASLLLLAALPALAGWCVEGEVVSVVAPGAADGPAFAPRQRTAVLAPAGHAATLECRVLRLRDKSVSWVRSRDLQILSHAGAVFTADARVSATAAAADGAASRHTLRIERLRAADAGRYECQINTEPKMSLFYNLTVIDEVVPEVVVQVVGAARVTGRAGGAATLACEARYEPAPRLLPLPPLDIRWQRGDEPIDLESGRGVALDTQRWAARALSRLTLARLGARDAGAYTCSASGRAAALRLVLDEDEAAEAMQRDAAAGSAPAPPEPAPAALLPLLALLALALR